MKLGLSQFILAVMGFVAVSLTAPAPASAETYQEYLARLRQVCSVDCLQPRDFQRAARRRGSDSDADMALIMDVVAVRRVDDHFELLSMDMQGNPLEELAVLGSAGINTSSHSGIGGLPSARRSGTHPNLIIIEIDEQTLYDILNVAAPLVEGTIKYDDDAEIIVEADRERRVAEPSLQTLRSYFRNRRVVVRGQPKLEAVFIGARRDFRRKQVTLVVDDADEIVLLPRYDEDGEPILGTE